jgi:hypothetical protein
LLAQSEDPILHATHDQVGFNKDHSPLHVDQGRKYLPSSYFIIFYLPNIYMQIRPGVTSAWSSATPRPMSPQQRHCHHDSTTTSHHCQYWLNNAITSMTQGFDAYFPDQQFDSSTLLPTSPISTLGERIVTTMIWDTSPN